MHGDKPDSLEGAVKAIEKSFTDAENLTLSTARHPTDPSLTPVAVLPVLPDDVCWENEYLQATFDVDPSLMMAGDMETTYSRDRVAKALVKGETNRAGKAFLSYLVPAEGSSGVGEAAGIGEDGEDVELEWVRDYHFELKTAAGDASTTYFLAVSDEAAGFNQVGSKVVLTRNFAMPVAERPSRITFRRREREEAEEEVILSKRARLLGGPSAPLAITDKSGEADAAADEEEEGAAAGAGGAAAPADEDGDDDDDPFGGADGGGGGGDDEAGPSGGGGGDDGFLLEEDDDDE